ncbi:hypothetical protein JCM11251_008026 [Rhodosporidiobolus azoricus]
MMATPSRPSTAHLSRAGTKGRPPTAPPPSIPLPPLPPLASSSNGMRTSTSSPQLPPLPAMPVLVAPSPSMPSLQQSGTADETEEGGPAAEEGGGEESRGKTVGWGSGSRAVDAVALESPVSSHFSSTTSNTGSAGRGTVSTRPSSADSLSSTSPKFTTGTIPLPSSSSIAGSPDSPSTPSPPSPQQRQRLERAKSVTVDGFDFDFVTPHLAPAAFSTAAGGFKVDSDAPPPPPSLPLPSLPPPPLRGTSPPDTPTAAGEVSTPRALAETGQDCGCDSVYLSGGEEEDVLDDGEYNEEDDDYDEEAERILAEAGLGGLGLGLLRRQSEALGLVRAGGVGGKGSIAPGEAGVRRPGVERGETERPVAVAGRSTTPPGAPPQDPVVPLQVSSAAVKLLRRRRAAAAKQSEKQAKKERRKSKDEFERDRFAVPTQEEIGVAARCELVGEGGTSVTFEQLLRERRKKVVVIFLRHAWCGLCAQFVEALNKAHRNLDTLAHSSTAPPSLRSSVSSTTSSGSPTLPPLYVLLISNGSAAVIPTYRQRLETPFPLYMDRTRKLYKALGMTRKTWDMGSDKDKGSYIVKSQMGNITSSIAAGVAMPHYPGQQGQLGGEFVFEYDEENDEIRCNYAARMVTTRGHSEIRDIFAAAGVELNDADAASVYGGN